MTHNRINGYEELLVSTYNNFYENNRDICSYENEMRKLIEVLIAREKDYLHL